MPANAAVGANDPASPAAALPLPMLLPMLLLAAALPLLCVAIAAAPSSFFSRRLLLH